MSNTHDQQLDADRRVELTALWSRNQYMIEAFIRSLVTDAHDRDDVLQETAKQVALMFQDYDPERPFANWAVGIARLKVLECRNQHRRNGKMIGGDMLDQVADAFARHTPDDRPQVSALEKCVAGLKPRHRTLLDLRYVEEMSVTHIADRVGVKPNTIAVSLYKIRAQLAECIKRRVRSEQGGEL